MFSERYGMTPELFQRTLQAMASIPDVDFDPDLLFTGRSDVDPALEELERMTSDQLAKMLMGGEVPQGR